MRRRQWYGPAEQLSLPLCAREMRLAGLLSLRACCRERMFQAPDSVEEVLRLGASMRDPRASIGNSEGREECAPKSLNQFKMLGEAATRELEEIVWSQEVSGLITRAEVAEILAILNIHKSEPVTVERAGNCRAESNPAAMSKSGFEESDHRQSKLNKALLGSMYDFEVSDEVDDESAKEAVVEAQEKTVKVEDGMKDEETDEVRREFYAMLWSSQPVGNDGLLLGKDAVPFFVRSGLKREVLQEV